MQNPLVKSPAQTLLFREDQLASATDFLQTAERSDASGLLLVTGDSGTGKTTFIKRLLDVSYSTDAEPWLLYVDLFEDEFTTANLLESLVALSWSDQDRRAASQPANIPRGLSFSDFVKKRKVRKVVMRHLYNAIRHSAGLIPWAKSALEILPEPGKEPDAKSLGDADLAQTFVEYLEWLSKHTPVVLAIDNYQFLQQRLRLMLESRIGAIRRNVSLILADRLTDGVSSIQNPTCFAGNQHKVELVGFDPDQTASMVRASGLFGPDGLELACRDCYFKTEGNLKDIELYLRRASLARSGDVGEGLVQTIDNLPVLARSVILLTSIFTAGLKRQYVVATLRKLASPSERDRAHETLEELVALGYIVINGISGETVRAAHERIVRAMRESVTEDEVLEVRQLVAGVLDRAISDDLAQGEYFYVLHCLVGVLHLNEALVHIEQIVQLITYQHGAAKYDYVTSIFGSSPKLVAALPPVATKLVLDSLQKTSQFALGQVILRELRATQQEDPDVLSLFDAKYRVQMYRPHDALESLESVRRSPSRQLVQLNALLCLCRDDEARKLLEDMEAYPDREELYVALRNSAHLFPLDQALDNLMRAHEFFLAGGSRFLLATVLNNLGVVHLWAGNEADADRTLHRARDMMSALDSREIYQSTVNLAALWCLRGDAAKAIELLASAGKVVPRELLLDRIMIRVNETLTLLEAGRITADSALEVLRENYTSSLAISDPRFHDVIAASYVSLLGSGPNEEQIRPSSRFTELVRERSFTGYEVAIGRPGAQSGLSPLLILSPHWRH